MSGVVRLAVLGDPLSYTRSPDLHRAGCEALGIACDSLALRTSAEQLPATLARLAGEGYTGCNLTLPLKHSALACMQAATPAARRARSVNTVTFGAAGLLGDTTDGAGFVDLLASLGRAVEHARVVLLGAGGAARSLAVALADAGARVGVVSRREPAPEAAWGGALGDRWHAWGSPEAAAAAAAAEVLVNCTPLGADAVPVSFERLRPDALVVDLTYAAVLTPWVLAARAQRLEAVDGLGLLVHQARHSLSRWFGREVPLAPLAAAVGWPR
jgi:shikimate dehydrogenase